MFELKILKQLKFKRKLFVLFFVFVLLVIASISSFVYADEIDDDEEYIWSSEDLEEIKNSNKININSRNAVVYDRTSKEILFGKNEEQKVKMASTTKIMTAIILLENVKDLNKEVEVCKKASSIGGSRLGLKEGDKITYNDLLYGLMMRSGNDTAVEIAISIAGSIEEFSNLMNNKAEELGLENTHFVTPHGLDNDNHYTTAIDLARVTDYALNIDKFKEVVGTKTYTVRINGNPKVITNTNELLGTLNGVYGVKTGFTNGALRCLVTSAKRNDFDIICVVLGADTKKIRTKDSIKLIEYTYKNYERINLEEIILDEFNKWKEINEGRIYIEKGTNDRLDLGLDLEEGKYLNYPIKKEEIDKIIININTINYIEAPVHENELIGMITVNVNGKDIEKISIINEKDIRKKNIFDYFKICVDGII